MPRQTKISLITKFWNSRLTWSPLKIFHGPILFTASQQLYRKTLAHFLSIQRNCDSKQKDHAGPGISCD